MDQFGIGVLMSCLSRTIISLRRMAPVAALVIMGMLVSRLMKTPMRFTLGVLMLLPLTLCAGCIPPRSKSLVGHQPMPPPVAPPPSAGPNPPGTVPADLDARLDIGVGYDSMSDQVRPRCVNQTSANLPATNGSAQYGQMSLDEITSENDLASSLGISANASFGIGLFSADASVQYLSSGKLTSYSSYLLVTSSNQNARQLLTGYTLTEDAKAALKLGLPQFVELCGDQFVSGRITGGSISAVLSASSSTTSEQQDATATLHAAAGFGGSVDGSVQSKLQSYQDAGRLNVKIIRQGPGEAWPKADIVSLISYAQSFPAKVASDSNSAWVTSYIVSTYNEILEKWNAPAAEVAFYAREGPYLQQLYQTQNDYSYILANNDQFGATSTLKLNNEISSLGSEINRVQAASNLCLSDSSQCSQLAHVTLPNVPTRVDPWVPLDPKINTYRQYFTVVAPDQKILEITGDFWTQCGNHDAGSFGPTQWDIQFVSRKTGAVLYDGPYSGGPTKVPQDSIVNIHVIDPEPGDNCGVDSGPRVRLFSPVFPDDY